MIHQFAASHRWEQEQGAFLASIWKAWCPFAVRRPVLAKATQLRGVDAYLGLGAKTIPVEEKVRRKDYGDMLLELESSSRAKTPGWAVKGSEARLLLYAFADTRRAWVFPMSTVQNLTQEKAREWRNRFGVKLAKNRAGDGSVYVTTNVAVPIDEFVDEVDGAHGLCFCPTCRMVSRWSDLRGPFGCSECKPTATFEVSL